MLKDKKIVSFVILIFIVIFVWPIIMWLLENYIKVAKINNDIGKHTLDFLNIINSIITIIKDMILSFVPLFTIYLNNKIQSENSLRQEKLKQMEFDKDKSDKFLSEKKKNIYELNKNLEIYFKELNEETFGNYRISLCNLYLYCDEEEYKLLRKIDDELDEFDNNFDVDDCRRYIRELMNKCYVGVDKSTKN